MLISQHDIKMFFVFPMNITYNKGLNKCISLVLNILNPVKIF